MSDLNNASGVVNNPSGEVDPEKTPETVRYETHKKLLGEKKETQERLRKAQEELDAYKAKEQERQNKELESQGNYRKLLEQKDDELKRVKLENDAIITSLNEAKKRQAVLKNISGMVPPNAHALLPINMVKLDENGELDEQSVKAAAQIFEQEYSFAVQRNVRNGGMPTDAANPQSKKLTRKEWEALPTKEMKARYGDVDWDT